MQRRCSLLVAGLLGRSLVIIRILVEIPYQKVATVGIE